MLASCLFVVVTCGSCVDALLGKWIHDVMESRCVPKSPVIESPLVVVIAAAANRISRSIADMLLCNQNRSILAEICRICVCVCVCVCK